MNIETRLQGNTSFITSVVGHMDKVIKNYKFNCICFNESQFTYDVNQQAINSVFVSSPTNTIVFEDCVFEELKFKGYLEYSFQFKNCQFGKITFENILFNKVHEGSIEFTVEKGMKYTNSFIEKLILNNSAFNNKFYINDQKKGNSEVIINYLEIKESKFNHNFKLHNTVVKEVSIDGIDFEKNADFFNTVFLKGADPREGDDESGIIFYSVNVKGLTIFEECEFHEKISFKYVTFSGLVQFRSADFIHGLNLDKTNIEKEINFYNVKGLEKNSEKNKTSQETYRILKFNCEKMGNIIDANHYHSLELEKRKEYLNGKYFVYKIKNFPSEIEYFLGLNENREGLEKQYKGSLQEWIVFNINYIASIFATSWLLPLLWMIVLGVYTSYSVYWSDGTLDKLLEMPKLSYLGSKEYFYDVYEGLKISFKYMSIIKVDEYHGSSIMFFFNKVLLGYLYYQFITAVRKDTRK
ncbi:MAG: hypothetical protein ACI8WT_003129 [Clostridium sp.]|jgi:hypothetical protein